MRLSIAVLLCLGLFCGTGYAEFYKYKDSSGSLVIKNRYEDVPKEYRNKAKVVSDRDLEAKDPLARRWNEAREKVENQQHREPEQQTKQRPVPDRKKPPKEKTLVVTVDETTGEVIRRFE